jgi:hypothetical protein
VSSDTSYRVSYFVRLQGRRVEQLFHDLLLQTHSTVQSIIQICLIARSRHLSARFEVYRLTKVMSTSSALLPVLLLCAIGSIVTTHSKWLMTEAFSTTSSVRTRRDIGISSTTLFSDYQKQLEALSRGSASNVDTDGPQQPLSSSSPSSSMGSYLDSLSQPQEYYSSVQFEEAPLQELAASSSTMAPVPLVAPMELPQPPLPAPTKPTVFAASAASFVSSKAAPMKVESSPTLSATSPTISITLPVGLRPPKLEKPKNIKYGEESRKFRRTVYTHDDWERHRSPDRFVRNLVSIVASGVYKVWKKEGLEYICGYTVAPPIVYLHFNILV